MACTNFLHHATDFLLIGLKIINCQSNALRDNIHILCIKATGGHCWGSQTQATCDEGTSLFIWNCILTVSYTHLDVYKRQLWLWTNHCQFSTLDFYSVFRIWAYSQKFLSVCPQTKSGRNSRTTPAKRGIWVLPFCGCFSPYVQLILFSKDNTLEKKVFLGYYSISILMNSRIFWQFFHK